ncbi:MULTISPECIES: ABC transporter substrate-binding protein [Pandoraea]|uniref:Nitrate ABC transporter substrate-binding protein n=1 Tax=Pandoraea capi TaxID=2508286 RepID=A0ABY6W7F4_9BURK|nr:MULTISPECIES: ABC transporter substrate-binding protein [Pandoraea]ODP35211.1 nitrate ABC transporter substrate-binding protein [Pandoraea sp. ISTKB]VVE35334.1 nitrate ABC transporter substrate-binding protein [Pandoraea capi]
MLSIFRASLARRAFLTAGLCAVAGLAGVAAPVMAQQPATQQITYLLPAPANLPAFAPLMLAEKKGYYAAEGLSVRWLTVQGGADVGKQLASGNGDLGGGLGDTPIVLRPNGIPIKGVALLGGRTLHQLVVRDDANIKSPADLKGKTITVLAYQDTGFYATLGLLASAGLTRNDARIQGAGPAGVWQQVATGKAEVMVGTPEWAQNIEDAGVKVTMTSTDKYFPGMAQAILASDKTIAEKPEMIRKFVRATVKSVAEIMRDPAGAAKEYCATVPGYKGKEAEIEKILTYYARNVYPGQQRLGAFDPARVTKLQDFYAQEKVIREKSKVDDLFTNQFVQ